MAYQSTFSAYTTMRPTTYAPFQPLRYTSQIDPLNQRRSSLPRTDKGGQLMVCNFTAADFDTLLSNSESESESGDEDNMTSTQILLSEYPPLNLQRTPSEYYRPPKPQLDTDDNDTNPHFCCRITTQSSARRKLSSLHKACHNACHNACKDAKRWMHLRNSGC